MNARRIALAAGAVAVTLVVALRVRGAHAASSARALPYYSDVSLTPRWPVTAGDRAAMHRVGNFNLVDASRRPVTRRDVRGRIYVASFFYTECRTLCPDLRAQLARVRDAFAGDSAVRILSHSVMPERDDPARLAHYAVRNGVDGTQWKLLTGAHAELARLEEDVSRPRRQVVLTTKVRRELSEFPIPAYEMAQIDRYLLGSIQFSSGCPYQCEFCDIPALYGRVPRLKTPQQVTAELDKPTVGPGVTEPPKTPDAPAEKK